MSNDPIDIVGGYDIGEINEIADTLFQTLVDLNLPTKLAILGLCRAITIMGTGRDLDEACRHIDILSDIPYADVAMGEVDEDIEWVDEEGDVNE